jgi:hypothetical protein
LKDGGTERLVRGRSIIFFLWAFAGAGAMLVAWSLATPLGAAPDEPAHIAQAVAIVRGQFDEPEHFAYLGTEATVRVPSWADLTVVGVCYSWRGFGEYSRGFGGCPTDLPRNSSKTVAVGDEYSNAPPLYYAVVGIPSLFLSGTSALYAMRLIGDLVNAALVALGIWLLFRYFPFRTPLVGALIALSPMVLFSMSVVSWSSLEIASGFASWCGALCVARHTRVPRALAIWTAVAASFLLLSRPTGLLDLAIIAVVMVVLVGWKALPARLNRSLRPLWIPVSVVAAVALLMLLIDGLPHLLGFAPSHPRTLLANMETTLSLTGGRLLQCIGNFDWLNNPAPTWVVVVWGCSLAALTAAALFLSRPCRRALPVLALLILAMPLALESPQINTVGTFWVGRYWLPVLVGVPLVASTFEWPAWRLGESSTSSRRRAVPVLTLVVGLVLMAAQVASFHQALWLNESVVIRGQARAVSAPPGGNALILLVFVVGAILTLTLVVAMTARQPEVDVDALPPRQAVEVEPV